MGSDAAEPGESAGLTRAGADRALTVACAGAGLSSVDAELIRLGSSAVYRLAVPVVVRVSSNIGRPADAEREVAVARWLESEGFPATRALDVVQPVVAAGHVVTFWTSASEREEYAAVDQVAAVIRDFHRLTAPASLRLPTLDPFAHCTERSRVLAGLSGADAAFLREAVSRARRDYADMRFALPAGVVHGDASVGNVILDRDGHAVLIDLDEVSVGPREWDLLQTAMYYDRFGWHTGDEYATFVRVYGFDVMDWPGYSALADIREALMVLWLAQRAADDEVAAAEVRKRIATMRDGGSRRDWRPY